MIFSRSFKQQVSEGADYPFIDWSRAYGVARFAVMLTSGEGEADQLATMLSLSSPTTRAYFVQRVDKRSLANIEEQLGYAKHYTQGPVITRDKSVQYFRSIWKNRPCYFFTRRGTHYIFVTGSR